MAGRDIVAIAGSAGAVQEILALVAKLPGDYRGSLFILVHTSAEGPGLLAQILGRSGRLPVRKSEHGESIRPGHIYVAPPDRHLLVRAGTIELGSGPRENGFRPAADPLFRTAAHSYGPRVVGVVLSGGMSDGTLGLQVIKQHGGIAMVQDPHEALYPSMPESALRNVSVDHVLRVSAMPRVLVQLSRENVRTNRGVNMKHTRQPADTARAGDLDAATSQLEGPPSGFICPECGGALWELENGKFLHYRCHVGHAYTSESLVAWQDEEVEEALWAALRTLEETAALRRRLADDARHRNMPHVAVGYEQRAQDIEQRAGVIRKVLLPEELPRKLKGYGSSKHSKFLSKNVEQTSKRNGKKA